MKIGSSEGIARVWGWSIVTRYRIPSYQFAEQETKVNPFGERLAVVQSTGELLAQAGPAQCSSMSPRGGPQGETHRCILPAGHSGHHQPPEPVTSEPAVSDAAWECRSKRHLYVSRSVCELEFAQDGLVLRTRKEWKQRHLNDQPLNIELRQQLIEVRQALAAKDAEMASLREMNSRMRALAEMEQQKRILLQDELERLRKSPQVCPVCGGFPCWCDKRDGVTRIVNDLPDFGKIPSPEGNSFPPSHRYRRLP